MPSFYVCGSIFLMLDSPIIRVAAKKIQGAYRGYLARQDLAIKMISVGKGITSFLLTMKKPSMLFGEVAKVLDRNKPHKIMVTKIDPNLVSVLLSTNQGTHEGLVKHLKDHEADYGAVVNGGFYAINGFYELPTNMPIGLHRFSYNASMSHKIDTMQRNVDNTSEYFKHAQDALTERFEDYEHINEIASQLHLKTQTPDSVKELYGLFRISHDGDVDLQKLTDFKDDDAFQKYRDTATYLLSSGPMLVSNSEVMLTSNHLQTDQRFQFQPVFKHFGSHPGSVPPGTFYHADQLNPRSAIGITDDGKLQMVTVAGEEEPSKRDGMKLDEFALLMKLLGAKTALNLDGGYSSCQGVFNATTMDKPFFIKSAGREKLLPCAIVATQKTQVSINYTRVLKNAETNSRLNRARRKIQFPA